MAVSDYIMSVAYAGGEVVRAVAGDKGDTTSRDPVDLGWSGSRRDLMGAEPPSLIVHSVGRAAEDRSVRSGVRTPGPRRKDSSVARGLHFGGGLGRESSRMVERCRGWELALVC